MSASSSPAHESADAVPSGLSDTDPPDEWKRHIKERINTNLQKLFQVTEELYRRRLQKVRSDEERVRIKEVHKLEIDQIHALAAEEYHTQLELNRQRQKWVLGQPIDVKWWDVLMREHCKIFESYEFPETARGRKGAQGLRSNEPAAEGRTGVPSSPVKHEIWRPNVNAEEEAAGTGLARRGSKANQGSVGSYSIHSLTPEPILEWPDGGERGNVPKKDDGELVALPGAEPQHQSLSFQLLTEPTERWEKPPASGMGNTKLPNSTSPVQSSANCPPGYSYFSDEAMRELGYESEAERIRLRYKELTRLESEEAVKREEAERMMREKLEEIMKQEEEVRRKMEEARKMEGDARKMSEEAQKQQAEARKKQEEAKRKEKEARRLEEKVKRKEEEARRKEEDARRKEEEVRQKVGDARLPRGLTVSSEYNRDPDNWNGIPPSPAPGLSDAEPPGERNRKITDGARASERCSPSSAEIWGPKINAKEPGARRGLARNSVVREKIKEIKEQEEAARKTAEEARKMSAEAKSQEEEASRKQEEAMRLEEGAKRKEEEARRLEKEVKRKEGEEGKEEEVRRKVEDASLSHMGSMSRDYQDLDDWTNSPPSPAPGLSDTELPDERKRKIMDSARASEHPTRNDPSSPVKYENWRPDINTEEKAAGRRKDYGEPVTSPPDKGKELQHQNRFFQLVTEPNELREEIPVPVSSSPPLSESFHGTLQLLLVTLTELWAIRGPLVNDETLVLFRRLLNVPDTTIASGVETADSGVELFLDFLLHVCSVFSVHTISRTTGSLQDENFAQDAKRKARKLMIKLVSKTNVLPRHLFIADVEIEPPAIAVGGFGRVFKGKYGGQLVALKMLYQSRRPGDSIEKDLYTEAFAWRSLSHRFILPLLGIYEEGSQLFLVSPFMTNGPLRDWRKNHKPVRIAEIRRLLLEVAEGVQYIHSEGIVHGDLHGANVLLDSEFHCRITDFGSTRHCDVTVTRSTTTLSFNFAAPELIGMCATCGELDCDEPHNDEDEQHNIKTMETDVYAFGCLYYAIFFDTVPFHGKRDLQIIRLVTKGVRPQRLENPIMEEHVWNLVQRCWKSTPFERPTMEVIMATLTLDA